ncbi:MAG: ParB N-terminal domain-containing protein [Mangrovicoccus sp.]|nr:ParB N-terminal domain-containing protein [Mangrovicoccus sp.]
MAGKSKKAKKTAPKSAALAPPPPRVDLQLSEDARAWRDAEAQGMVLQQLDLDEVQTDDLPRDRLDLHGVAGASEMSELKASIRERGQREPIEVYLDDRGRYQLLKGWRRLTALRQLHAETGHPAFATATARVTQEAWADPDSRMERYIDMVEENVVRQDLTFAEMAQVALRAAADPGIEGDDPDEMVGELYASLHKMKRSYIRSFVFLLATLGEAVQWPKEISRNQGVAVARAIKAAPEAVEELKQDLARAADDDAQSKILEAFLKAHARSTRARSRELKVGNTTVKARKGECRIVSTKDFSEIPQDRLAKAIEAFEAALKESGDAIG